MAGMSADRVARVAARDVRIHGRVQGVFFRDSARREAVAHGVTGWVRNEPDGSVRAHLEGSSAAVDQVLTWCREGPSRGHVERVDVSEAEVTGATSFDVRG